MFTTPITNISASVKDCEPKDITIPMTGNEYLESLRDDREVWIYGERVKDVTEHPAFRNCARMVARLYDAMHDPNLRNILTCDTDTGNGGFTHPFFKVPYSARDLVAAREAIVTWQRIGYGWMGRSPDYKAAFLATLGTNTEIYSPYQENALAWYRRAQERLFYLNHALVHPPIDRNRPADETADVCVHVEKETDAGLIVSGAKVVATNSALTNYNFIAHYGLPIQKKEFALACIIPTAAPGLKLICRPSYAMTADVMGSPFDYPLSSRLDENDAIMVLDKVLVPWENVLIYGDLEKTNKVLPASGFVQRLALHGCTRLAVKLDFIAGLLLKAVEATGTSNFRGVQVQVGEVIAWRNLFWGLTDSMVLNPVPWIGDSVLPNPDSGAAYRVFSTVAYSRIKEIIEQTVGSGLIYINSHASDFQNPELRPYLDKYIRGSNNYEAIDRVKLMKLLWDAFGSEFGGRHELYERNYAGNHEEIRIQALYGAIATGQTQLYKGFAEQCMAEYDINGWTTPDLINPTDVNYFTKDPSP
ncbi:pyoverdin chromophore biosynthetic protein pvcC [Rivularia sp. IAM M-261]|nr:pyoverdin chromophore biosynthetic protein pvcC [Rivularia sp. IAM M-261]